MRKLLVLLLLTSPVWATIGYVNSTSCAATTSCATTWSVTPGHVLVVGRFGTTNFGTLSDSYSDIFTNKLTYYSTGGTLVAADVTMLTSSGTVTVSSTLTEQNIVLAEFSGLTLTAGTPSTGGGAGAQPVCPLTGSLSVTTAAASLLLSVWHNVAGYGTSCTASSGTVLGTAVCGFTQTGQMTYQIVGAGTFTEVFTFAPGYNSGSTSCGMVALTGASAGASPVHRRIISGQ